ncbi:hypothetical protein ANCCEY_05198 [Ancylostoma ceylanicum]|uniref:SCP domain-containing protein n=1 Tax=Ancylostoma ceylanicum TaxID=53326 RepID=A0A0D6M021_9BILA|nr:hypothetical protein ANCCEY_05198 [Ancylostoma ceylanicum]
MSGGRKYLEAHNRNRRLLAQKKIMGQTDLLPMAKKMQLLVGPVHTFEDEYRSTLRQTAGEPRRGGIPTKKTCDATALVDTTLKKLFKDGAKKQADTTFVPDNKDFNQVSLLQMATILHMAYEATTAIGCSYKRCGSELNLLCFYNKERLLATGWAEDGKIKYAKPAAAMPKLEYNCDVEKEIVDVTSVCDGNTAKLTKPNNVAILNTLALTREEALKQYFFMITQRMPMAYLFVRCAQPVEHEKSLRV